MESILTTIKKMLGIEEECVDFDMELIPAINSAFFFLTQLGVGPSSSFVITGDSETWDDFIPEDVFGNHRAIRSYIHLRAKLIFDPPANSTLTQSIEKMISELEWRLNVTGDSIDYDRKEDDQDG
jgi:hypothetical protein